MIAKKKKFIFLAVAAALLVALVIWIAWGNTALELNTYTVSSSKLPQSFDGYRIAHVSDLHNAEMGKDNERLLAMLREARPNIIAITGDLIDSRRTDVEVALRFVEEAVRIAPCYYVSGNHEARVPEYAAMKARLQAIGVTVLSDERVELEANGQSISVLGVDDPSFQTAYLSGDTAAVMRAKLQSLGRSEDAYTVLLSHRPEVLDTYAAYGIDLVLSGHAHGGQIRLPLIGGLVAPNQGLFPRYDAGVYTSGSTQMVVSRGIGNSLFPFRLNNRPEVVLIELAR